MFSFPDETSSITVRIGMSLVQIEEFHELNGILTLRMYYRQIWWNKKLTWDPEEYENISEINVNPKLVWSPDIYIYDSRGEEKIHGSYLNVANTLISLRHDGRHMWLAPFRSETNCPLHVIDYPFDIQQCDIRLGSMTLDSKKLIVKSEAPFLDLSMFHNHPQWLLTSNRCFNETNRTNARTDNDQPDNHQQEFSTVVCHLNVKRKPMFLISALILPNVGLSFLSILVYFVPAASRQRVIMVCHLILALAFFQTKVLKMIPGSAGEIPFFSYFLALTLSTLVILIATLCYSLSIFFANKVVLELPHWLRYYVLEQLTPGVGLRIIHPTTKWLKQLERLENTQRPNRTIHQRAVDIGIKVNSIPSERLWRLLNLTPLLEKVKNSACEENWAEVSQQIVILVELLKEQEKRRRVQREWLAVAATLDRISFFTTATIFTTVSVWYLCKVVDF
uniref:Uncharacterized protein n=2 Tax=Clytia hemisphaerica TaxID=252671 RepID=A0A7M5X2L2_9CNID